MKYDVIGYYVDCDTALCVDCAKKVYGDDITLGWIRAGGFEGWDTPGVIFPDTESDYEEYCADCGELIPSTVLQHDEEGE